MKNTEKPGSACDHWREAIRSASIGEEESPGLREHLAHCASCGQYARDVALTAADLKSLSERPVEVSPAFEKRWKQAVLSADTRTPAPDRSGFGEILAILVAMLRRNWRPAFSVALVWLTIAALRLDAPQIQPKHASAALSPKDVAHFLTAEKQFLATVYNENRYE